MTRIATDNVKALAHRSGLTREAVRATARDLGLVVTYSTDRRTWIINEPAEVVARFNAHLLG